MIGNLTAFILSLAFFMVLGFFGIASAYTAIVTYRTNSDPLSPAEQQIVIQPSYIITVYAYLEALPQPQVYQG